MDDLDEPIEAAEGLETVGDGHAAGTAAPRRGFGRAAHRPGV
ncbi:MAG: hypothetical protein Q9O74_11000 [Planctomycetota bacterium]|nr:hypothetical protein [Planctomycetota bacterium]